jgi:small subunit ribosomal protein S6
MKDAVMKFEQVLKENSAELIHQENWGLKKLAYPIQKKSTGFYQLFEFKAAGDVVDKLEIEFRRDERIMRFLTVSLDKYGVQYNSSRRSGLNGTKKERIEKIDKSVVVAPKFDDLEE